MRAIYYVDIDKFYNEDELRAYLNNYHANWTIRKIEAIEYETMHKEKDES